MTMIFRLAHAARYFGMVVVMAGILVPGFLRGAEAVAAAPVADTAPKQAPKASDIKKSTTAAGTAIKVSVSLSPAVAAKAAPDDVVFIFARAANGSRMPLAIVRAQVKDLPATVVLDDAKGMSPEMKLSSAPEIVMIARVSKFGTAEPRNGDLEGMSAPMASGTKTVSISIDKVLTGQKGPSPHNFR